VIPAAFDYVRAATFDDAFSALADPDAKVIAGGLSLLPMMKLRLARPTQLVDIAPLGLSGIDADADGTRVGALTTYAELLSASRGNGHGLGAIADCAARVGDLQVRNAGTVGGGVAHADPASDLAAGVLAMEARVVLRSPRGTREVDAADFFVGPFTTALDQVELLVELRVPHPQPNQGSAYVSVEDPASGYPIAGAAVRIRRDGDRIVACTVGITGAAGHPFRAQRVEELIVHGNVPTVAELHGAFADLHAMSDVIAGAAYRRHLAAVVVHRAATRAFDNALPRGAR